MQDSCRSDLTTKELESLCFIKEDLFPTEHAWPMQINVPYRSAINNIISRLHTAGMFHKWRQDYTPLYTISKTQPRLRNTQPQRLSFTTFVAPGFILLIGVIMALVVFVIEISWKQIYLRCTQSIFLKL